MGKRWKLERGRKGGGRRSARSSLSRHFLSARACHSDTYGSPPFYDSKRFSDPRDARNDSDRCYQNVRPENIEASRDLSSLSSPFRRTSRSPTLPKPS